MFLISGIGRSRVRNDGKGYSLVRRYIDSFVMQYIKNWRFQNRLAKPGALNFACRRKVTYEISQVI